MSTQCSTRQLKINNVKRLHLPLAFRWVAQIVWDYNGISYFKTLESIWQVIQPELRSELLPIRLKPKIPGEWVTLTFENPALLQPFRLWSDQPMVTISISNIRYTERFLHTNYLKTIRLNAYRQRHLTQVSTKQSIRLYR